MNSDGCVSSKKQVDSGKLTGTVDHLYKRPEQSISPLTQEFKMWRIVKILLAIYLIGNLIAAYLFWPRIDQFVRFMPRVKAPAFSASIDALEAQKQDLSYLGTILNYDRSFSDEARAIFLERSVVLQEQSQVLSEASFYLATRELISLADNGHTAADSAKVSRDFNRSGVDFYRFADGYYIVRAHKDHQELLGQEITEIEGRPIAEIMIDLRRFTGGPENWRDLQSLQILRSPELLHAAGLARSPDRLEITVETETGEGTKKTLKALAAPINMNYFRHAFLSLSPQALGDEGTEWVRTLDASSNNVAPYLTDLSDIVTNLQIEGGLYVRSNYLLGSSENPVKDMLLDPLTQAPSGGYDFIIVDLRWNPGGDYGNATPFARRVKSALSVDGKVYVITGSGTFSAAIVFSALIKQFAGDQTLIVGESMGDRPQFWAERGKPFILPNSKLWISYATGYHDWEQGCADTHKYCFPPNKKWEQNIGSLQVDHIIAPRYADYASGGDVVMDWILAKEGK